MTLKDTEAINELAGQSRSRTYLQRQPPPVADTIQWFGWSRLRAVFLFTWGELMKICKSCRGVIIGEAANQSFPILERLMKLHGFTPETIPDVALTLGPMCGKCLKAWSNELTEAN